eukprot:CAMPEP_0185269982 /NCGR_PEP_ID=MMETSP1359-20130426/41211_1 /TAXON_ID=552665 /ORGANISM="Bigelowiella longifila, Strain CCMP242" /LENGTH=287 /DNA_ID=CAMNT_0027861383 /DNA_START=62 /DNA_END=925 /DNA_ORIENTATION=-
MAIVLRRIIKAHEGRVMPPHGNGSEEMEEGQESKRAAEHKEERKKKQETRGVEQQEQPPSSDLPDHVLRHCTRFPCKVKRSRDDLYAVEAVGTGSRMVTLEAFMDFWYNKRSEFVAWRALYKRSAETEHDYTKIKLDWESAKIVAGRPYVNPCELISGPLFRVVGCRCSEGKASAPSFFCSSLVASLYTKFNLLNGDLTPRDITPGDFGDDGAQTSVVKHMASGWTLGSVVYVRYPKRKIFPKRLLRLLSMRDDVNLGGDVEEGNGRGNPLTLAKVGEDSKNESGGV